VTEEVNGGLGHRPEGGCLAADYAEETGTSVFIVVNDSVVAAQFVIFTLASDERPDGRPGCMSPCAGEPGDESVRLCKQPRNIFGVGSRGVGIIEVPFGSPDYRESALGHDNVTGSARMQSTDHHVGHALLHGDKCSCGWPHGKVDAGKSGDPAGPWTGCIDDDVGVGIFVGTGNMIPEVYDEATG
jgi:hypothetical protein